jgi:hypothetical protein
MVVGQSPSKEGVIMSSEFEDPEAALAQLLKDNPDLAPQIVQGLKSTEADTREVVDAVLAHVDHDPGKAEQFFANFVNWVHEKREKHSKSAPNEKLSQTT